MSKPVIQILGDIYMPSGDVVVAGSITVWLHPPGQTCPDTSTNTMYKVCFSAESPIDATGIASLSVFSTQSLSNASAFYVAQIDATSPVQASWRELWRAPTVTGSLSVASITILDNTPVL